METTAATQHPPHKVVYRTIGSPQGHQPPVVTTTGQLPPSGKKFGFPWAFVLALGILAVIEIGLRCVDPVKLLPRQGGLSEYDAALLHMELFGAGDVAFFGSSRTREGIHAAQLQRMCQEELGKDVRVVNYSCPGARTDIFYAMINRLLDQRPRPRLIVIGLSPMELRGGGAAYERMAMFWDLGDWYNEYNARGLKFGSETLPTVLRHKIANVYATLRFRDRLCEILQSPFIESSVEFDDPLVAEAGHLQQESGDRTLENHPVRRNQVKRLFSLSTEGHTTVVAKLKVTFLDRTLAACRKAGVPVILLEMPTPLVVKQAMPRDTYEKFFNSVRGVVQRNRARLVTMSQLKLTFGNADFIDQSHLTETAADRLTEVTGKQVVMPALLRRMAPATAAATQP